MIISISHSPVMLPSYVSTFLAPGDPEQVFAPLHYTFASTPIIHIKFCALCKFYVYSRGRTSARRRTQSPSGGSAPGGAGTSTASPPPTCRSWSWPAVGETRQRRRRSLGLLAICLIRSICKSQSAIVIVTCAHMLAISEKPLGASFSKH